MAKAFYLIREDYLQRNKKEETIGWWKKAAETAPEWSYFHIELASLYLELGEKEKVESTLNNCMKSQYPKEHCQEYLNRLSHGKDFELPGYWRSRIITIPDNERDNFCIVV